MRKASQKDFYRPQVVLIIEPKYDHCLALSVRDIFCSFQRLFPCLTLVRALESKIYLAKALNFRIRCTFGNVLAFFVEPIPINFLSYSIFFGHNMNSEGSVNSVSSVSSVKRVCSVQLYTAYSLYTIAVYSAVLPPYLNMFFNLVLVDLFV